MKLFNARVFVVLILTSVFLSYVSVTHAKIYSYKLFDPMTVPQPAVIGGGRVAWWTQYPFHTGIINRGGKMLLSKNPDGTGSSRVGDTLQIWSNHPSFGNYIFTYNAYRPNCFFEDPPAMPVQDITPYFPVLNDPYDVTVRILDWCGKEKYTDALYLVNITNEPEPTPQSTPTITPTPTPVAPFLELPWDYKSKGLSFTEAALRIEAFFDHEFPFLSANKQEPAEKNSTIVKFDGTRSTEAYSSHDGYDYARRAQANRGGPVLAAAAGRATFSNTCAACGNMILIDHQNGYQTRYMHLDQEDLIVSQEGQSKSVVAGQPIGRVGFSGNVLPPGELGAHIHFMVVKDINANNTFADDIPTGIIDPFGWSGAGNDPWQAYSGTASLYLWKHVLDTTKASVKSDETTTVTLPSFEASFPPGTQPEIYTVEAYATPYSSIDTTLFPLGNAFLLSAYNTAQAAIVNFQKAFTLKIQFKKSDVNWVKPKTIAIYSSQDGKTWKKEKTSVNMSQQTATAAVDHMTYFAVLGERKDLQAPTTTARIKGKQGTPGWYRTPVEITLHSKDKSGGVGVDYTMYRINDGAWTRYEKPFMIRSEGSYSLSYFSEDTHGNRESIQDIQFTIDTTAPAVTVTVNMATGEISEQPLSEDVEPYTFSVTERGKNKKIATVADRAGNKRSATILLQ